MLVLSDIERSVFNSIIKVIDTPIFCFSFVNVCFIYVDPKLVSAYRFNSFSIFLVYFQLYFYIVNVENIMVVNSNAVMSENLKLVFPKHY